MVRVECSAFFSCPPHQLVVLQLFGWGHKFYSNHRRRRFPFNRSQNFARKRDLKLNFKISKDFWRFRNSRMCLFSMKEWSSVTLGRLRRGLFYKNCRREGSGGEEVVRATASISRGPAFEATWRLFYLFFFFYQWHSFLN